MMGLMNGIVASVVAIVVVSCFLHVLVRVACIPYVLVCVRLTCYWFAVVVVLMMLLCAFAARSGDWMLWPFADFAECDVCFCCFLLAFWNIRGGWGMVMRFAAFKAGVVDGVVDGVVGGVSRGEGRLCWMERSGR